MKTVALNCVNEQLLYSLACRYVKCRGSRELCAPQRRRSASWGGRGPLFDLEVFLVSCSAARLALLQPPRLNSFSESRPPLFSSRLLELWNRETARPKDSDALLSLHCTASRRGFCLSVVSSSACLSVCLSLLLPSALVSFSLCYALSLSPSLSGAALLSARFGCFLSVSLLLNKLLLLLNELQRVR